MFYYAVKRGKFIGVFFDYETCMKSVLGYPGAEFKRFNNPLDAIHFARPDKGPEQTNSTDQCAIVYTNGSCLNDMVGSGVVYITPEHKQYLNEVIIDKELATLKEIGGELNAIMLAIRQAIKESKAHITIYYNYKEVIDWIHKENECILPSIKYYKDFIYESKKDIVICFEWIKDHSNHRYNNRADFLAKNAIANEIKRRD